MKYTTLLFDADGTLFDFEKAEDISLRSFYKVEKFPCSYERFYEVYERENGLLWKALEEGRVKASEINLKRFENTMKELSYFSRSAEEMSRQYIDELAKCDFLLKGADGLIEKISSLYEMYIITNGLWDVQRRRIGNSLIYKYFNGLIVSEKAGSAKPDRGIFDEAFKTARNPDKKNVLIIGDSLNADIRGGNLYGIDTCWFNPEKSENPGSIVPTYEIGSFDELSELLLD